MAVGVTSLIVVPYIREHTIDNGATVKNGEAVFTHSSPCSSAPGTDRGTPAAIRSAILLHPTLTLYATAQSHD